MIIVAIGFLVNFMAFVRLVIPILFSVILSFAFVTVSIEKYDLITV